MPTTLKQQALIGTTRELLTADRTYYVRTDGNDANNGLTNTAGGAFLTLQAAYNKIASSIDFGGYTVTIQIADGTYTAGLVTTSAWVGGGQLIIKGNTASPQNVIISVNNSNNFYITTTLPGPLTIKDMELRSSTALYPLGCHIHHIGAGTVKYGNIRFGTSSAVHVAAASPNAMITCIANYAITGSAADGGGGIHFFATKGGMIECNYVTITVSPGLVFGRAFAYVELNSSIYCWPAPSFSSNVATGKRYEVALNGAINTVGLGASFFPGSWAGTVSTGGQYV